MAEDEDDDRSIAARAANGEGSEPDDDDGGELFPLGTLDGDPSVTLKTLISKGIPTSVAVSLMSAEVPAPSGGLFHPDREYAILVTVEPSYYKPAPVREGVRGAGRKITSWKITQSLKVIGVERIDGDPDAIEANFAVLADGDEAKAGEVLEKLTARFKAKMNGGKHPARVPAKA